MSKKKSMAVLCIAPFGVALAAILLSFTGYFSLPESFWLSGAIVSISMVAGLGIVSNLDTRWEEEQDL